MDPEWRRVILGLGMIAGFVFVVSFLSLVLQSSLPPELCSCEPWSWLPYLIPLLASLGVFVGGVAYYLASVTKERDLEKLKIEGLLKCLPEDEGKVLSKLLSGEKLQSQLARETGLGRVKVHRVIKSLKSKGVIEVEPYGKTNKIRLKLE